MAPRVLSVLLCLWISVLSGYGAVIGAVRGIVHDPQHRPIPGATVLLSADASAWSRSAATDSRGEFLISSVPAGKYVITVACDSFGTVRQPIEVQSGNSPVLHFPLKLAPLNQTVEISAAPELINPESSSTVNIVSRDEISRTPGADGTNSLSMITDFTPGAYIVHDQLHIRGGHQVSWLVDGVPIPNTNIGGNVGPQFDPHDVDYLETQRGGYSAEYGDRTYGVFNLVPRSGFERNDEAVLIMGYGNYNESNDHLSVGGHTSRFAYYGSVTGNRTDLGLQTPEEQVIHDLSSSISGFASFIYNRDSNDQFRLVGAARGDHYQVPNTQDQQDTGIRDVQGERDAFFVGTWLRTLGAGMVLNVSPYFHWNTSSLLGGQGDTPVITTDEHNSGYVGGEASFSLISRKQNLRVGFSSVGQRETTFLSLRASGGALDGANQSSRLWGNTFAAFAEDQYKITKWLTFNGGVRVTRFDGGISESALSPRLGAALRLPGLNWVLRGFYGRYYQAPPLSTFSGPVLDLAVEQGFGVLPLRGERDEQKEIGLAIPVGGWAADLSYFHTKARNFFDHTPLGNANIFVPVSITEARIRGFEATLQSPRIFRRLSTHLAYSRQYVEGRGGISGGLTDFAPDPAGFYYLDHDQRNTLSSGIEADLPGKTWLTANVSAGSGFLDGDGPAHLSPHATLDMSMGKSLGERTSLRLTVLNLTNSRYLLDNSNTFGGTHFNYPREITASILFRFHYR